MENAADEGVDWLAIPVQKEKKSSLKNKPQVQVLDYDEKPVGGGGGGYFDEKPVGGGSGGGGFDPFSKPIPSFDDLPIPTV